MIGMPVHPLEIKFLNGNLGTYIFLCVNLRVEMNFSDYFDSVGV